MNAPAIKMLPWQFYALMAIIAFSGVFICFKLASGIITPILFAGIAATVNCLGHGINIVRKKRHPPVSMRLPVSMVLLVCFVGLILASNDTSAVLMFSSAPLSTAMPVFTAGALLLTVLFGKIIMHEKLSKAQMTGILSAVIGIVLLNV